MLRVDPLPERSRKPVVNGLGRCGRKISNQNYLRRFSGTVGALFLLMVAPLLTLTGCGTSSLDFPTEYQAVYLDNGQIFFGKLGETGNPFPILRDVFFVQTQLIDKDKKETRNLLIRRGAEGHGPDFMRLNGRHIVVIEPVAPDSRVAQLIREAKAAPKPPETKEVPKEAPKTPVGK